MTLPLGYDRRLTAANGRVADVALKGLVLAESYVSPTEAAVSIPVADLLDAPNGKRDRQLLLGWALDVFERREGYAFVRSRRDGYVGYINKEAINSPVQPTHQIVARCTHAYSLPDLKSPEFLSISLGSLVEVTETEGSFAKTSHGYIPIQHIALTNDIAADPVEVAETFLGVPYLWGGNSTFGIDCSGLVQASFLASAIPCPGDSDLQETALGEALQPGTSPKRGDLFFWKGHVAIAVDQHTLIHANAHHMAVAYEPVDQAIQRIEEQGGGPVTSHRRLNCLATNQETL